MTTEAANLDVTTRTRELILKMLSNQADLNTKSYSTTWVAKGASLEFDYNLAASQEIAEFNNSFGYSWWSIEPKDISNCKTELVDAIHFMLSQAIIEFHTIEAAADFIYACKEESGTLWSRGTLKLSKGLTAQLNYNYTNPRDSTAWTYLFALAESIGFGTEKMYIRYIGKSLLNAFRQENGYRFGVYKFGEPSDGRYLKNWDGKNQDNMFLTKWLDNASEQPTEDSIKLWLDNTYAEFEALSATELAARQRITNMLTGKV